jgi:hypothetical protein
MSPVNSSRENKLKKTFPPEFFKFGKPPSCQNQFISQIRDSFAAHYYAREVLGTWYAREVLYLAGVFQWKTQLFWQHSEPLHFLKAEGLIPLPPTKVSNQ